MKNKLGISLITLVITIIVMIILAGAILFALSEAGIFDKANATVNVNDKKQIEHIALLAWAEAYVDGARTVNELQTAVNVALGEYKIPDKYIVKATENGVEPVYEVLKEKGNVDFTRSINASQTPEQYYMSTGLYPSMLFWDIGEESPLKEVKFYVKDTAKENAEFKPAKVSVHPYNEVVDTISGGTVMSSAGTYILFHELGSYRKAVIKAEFIYENNTIKYSYSDEIEVSSIPI